MIPPVSIRKPLGRNVHEAPESIYLAHNKLNFVDLTSRERVVPGGAVAQGAVEPMIAGVADASVQLVTVPDLSTNDKLRGER